MAYTPFAGAAAAPPPDDGASRAPSGRASAAPAPPAAASLRPPLPPRAASGHARGSNQLSNIMLGECDLPTGGQCCLIIMMCLCSQPNPPSPLLFACTGSRSALSDPGSPCLACPLQTTLLTACCRCPPPSTTSSPRPAAACPTAAPCRCCPAAGCSGGGSCAEGGHPAPCLPSPEAKQLPLACRNGNCVIGTWRCLGWGVASLACQCPAQ